LALGVTGSGVVWLLAAGFRDAGSRAASDLVSNASTRSWFREVHHGWSHLPQLRRRGLDGDRRLHRPAAPEHHPHLPRVRVQRDPPLRARSARSAPPAACAEAPEQQLRGFSGRPVKSTRMRCHQQTLTKANSTVLKPINPARISRQSYDKAGELTINHATQRVSLDDVDSGSYQRSLISGHFMGM